MMYFPPPPSALSAVSAARNAVSQMNLYGYTTQSMLPQRRMEMEARGRFLATGSGELLYGTLPAPGNRSRLRCSSTGLSPLPL